MATAQTRIRRVNPFNLQRYGGGSGGERAHIQPAIAFLNSDTRGPVLEGEDQSAVYHQETVAESFERRHGMYSEMGDGCNVSDGENLDEDLPNGDFYWKEERDLSKQKLLIKKAKKREKRKRYRANKRKREEGK
jgi:hypothetical protein